MWGAILLLMLDTAPPLRYDRAPLVYSVERVAEKDMGGTCKMPDPHYLLRGCTNGPALQIFIRDDLSGLEYEAVLHHEWAHLNGWRHN